MILKDRDPVDEQLQVVPLQLVLFLNVTIFCLLSNTVSTLYNASCKDGIKALCLGIKNA